MTVKDLMQVMSAETTILFESGQGELVWCKEIKVKFHKNELYNRQVKVIKTLGNDLCLVYVE